MPKLQKSKDKKEALLYATLNLVNSSGFQGASMSKVAKVANVSPATIYLYFENKQDLINQLYLKVKKEFSERAFHGIDVAEPVKRIFEQIWFNIASFKMEHPEEGSFLAQCDNTPMLDPEIREQGLLYLDPLLAIWKRGQEEGIIKPVSPYVLYAFTIYPMAFLLNEEVRPHCPLNKEKLSEAFKVAWDSIKV
jgi:AcrR family transcriptional regulator